ncbi:MAG: helix-turn-helix transcriptional regulator [Bacteroidales bacterium]
MNKRIIIIHSSEIIRSGLASLIRDNFHFPVDTFCEFNGNYIKPGHREHLLFFTDQKNAAKAKSFNNSISNQITVIQISPQAKPISKTPSDHEISINISSKALVELVNKHFSSPAEKTQRTSPPELSRRESEILALVARGYSNKEMAEKLFISTHTVISHRKNITEKLGIKTISGLTVYAVINGIIDLGQISRDDLI